MSAAISLKDINGLGTFVDGPGMFTVATGDGIASVWAEQGTDTITGGAGALTVYADGNSHALAIDGASGSLTVHAERAGSVSVGGGASGATIYANGGTVSVRQTGPLTLLPGTGTINVVPNGTNDILVWAADNSGYYDIAPAAQGASVSVGYDTSDGKTVVIDASGTFELGGGAWDNTASPNTLLGALSLTAPVIVGLDPLTDTGRSNLDGLTDDTEPTIVVDTVAPTDTVGLTDNGTVLAASTVTAGNAISLTPTAPLPDGPHVIVAKETMAGGVSVVSNTYTVEIDTSVPSTPTVTVASPLFIAGTADAGDTVIVRDTTAGIPLGTVVAESSFAFGVGHWSLSASPLSAGDTLEVVAESLSGETADVRGAATIAALAAALDSASATGSVNAAAIDTAPTIDVYGAANEAVTLMGQIGATTTVLGTGTTDATGVARIVPTLSFATVVTETITATAGTVASAPIVLDLTPIPVTTIGFDPVLSADGTHAAQGDVVFAGTLTNADTLVVSVRDGSGNVYAASSLAATNGIAWAFDAGTLNPGTYTVTAMAENSSVGLTGAPSVLTAIVEPTPSVSALGFAPGQGQLTVVNGATIVEAAAATLQGTLVAGGVIVPYGTIMIGDGKNTVQTTADVNGVWSAAAPDTLGIGASATLTVTPEDQYGDIGAAQTLTAKYEPAPVLSGTTLAANDGTPDHIGGTVTLTGTTGPGDTITFSANAPAFGPVTVNGTTGVWTATATAVTPRGYPVTITATDAYTDTTTASYTFTVDAPPSAPTIALAPGSDTGTQGDGRTTVTTPTLTGTVDPGDTLTVTVTQGGTTTTVGTATVTGGTWSFVVPSPLTVGQTYAFDAVAAVGTLRTSDTAPLALTIDPVPTTPTIGLTGTETDGTADHTLNQLVVLTGTADPGDAIALAGVPVAGSIVADGAGTWTAQAAAPLADGSYTVTATATDPHGNTATSNVYAFTIDPPPAGQTPATPTVTLAASSDTGTPGNGHTTVTTPTLSGTADMGDIITVTALDTRTGNPVYLGQTVAGTSGWSLAVAAPLTQGDTYTIEVFASDGGPASESLPLTLAIDPPPIAPTVGLAAGESDGTADHINVQTVTLTGTADAGDTITISSASAGFGPAQIDNAGTLETWSAAVIGPVGVGPHMVSVTATDAYGNQTVSSYTFTEDATPIPPPAPTVTLAPSSDTGTQGDGMTTVTTPTLTGTAASGDAVLVTATANGNVTTLGTVTASDGAWTLAASGLTVGQTYTIDATATDPVTTLSTRDTAPLSLTIVPPPATPTVGLLGGGTITASNWPVLTGNAPGDASVEFEDGATLIPLSSASVSGGGYAAQVGGALAAGQHTITAIASDPYGDTVASAPFVLTIGSPNPGLAAGLPANTQQVLAAVAPNYANTTFLTPDQVAANVDGGANAPGLAIGPAQDGAIVSVTAQTSVAVDAANGAVTVRGGGGTGQVFVSHAPEVTYLTNGSGVFIDDAPETATAPHGQDVIFTPTTGTASNDFIAEHGNNIFVLRSGNNTVDAGSGNNTIWIGPGSGLVLSRGNDTVVGGTGAETVDASMASTATAPVVFDGASSLEFINGSGDATVVSGSGKETVFGGAGGGVFYGGAGGGNILIAGQKASALYGWSDDSVLFAAGAGNDTLSAGAGNETLAGSAATGDNLYRTGPGSDVVFADAGKDTVLAAQGQSTIYGGTGGDLIEATGASGVISAGKGQTTIVGGTGTEVFGFAKGFTGGVTEIMNFDASRDTLRLWNYGAGEMANAIASQSDSGGSTTLTLSDGTKITLVGVGQVSANNFS